MDNVNQAVFDKAVKGLRKQGYKQAVLDATGVCVLYDRDTKLRCAVGHLLTLREMPTIEGSGLGYVIRKYPDVTADLFSELQRAHDLSSSAHDMMTRLREVAREFDLDAGEVR